MAKDHDAGAEVNYFVCTLGQAAGINQKNPHSFQTISEFLDVQAQAVPHNPAVGFPTLSGQQKGEAEWNHQVFTFRNLQQASNIVARELHQLLSRESDGPPSRTVALLCPSSVDFLFTWLGLMCAGYSVLLIAPQCQPSAIAHLCKSCKVSTLLFDSSYETLAKASAEASSHDTKLNAVCLPPVQRAHDGPRHNEPEQASSFQPLWEVSETDVAYLHHTSGTSTGLPKPIPQSHRAGVGVLPCLNNCSDKATFTTTPLYHGGIADCFRAWTSGAMIWLFPGKDAPITATNVLKSLKCAQKYTETAGGPRVAYFSSVPYVLQIVEAEEEGLQRLRNMEIVGVGGAALPQAVGDDLVKKGVNLVSRFGSAECGFLMSSHRDYTQDKEWQYLRSSQASEALKFEPQGDGLAELVILPQWLHMAKRNRDDGSFATADLFAAHPTIPHAWKYHSRADSQLTLITGKKFDPAPLEAAIATSPLLDDVLIFGNGQQYPGALLFPSATVSDIPDSQLLEELWPVIEKLNTESQGHTRLSKAMLVVMPTGTAGLEKSSKGTILRGQSEKKYAAQITQAYEGDDAANDDNLGGESTSPVPDDEVPVTILNIIKSVTNSADTIPEDADLFSQGVDSVACMQIRAKLQKRLLPPRSASLPLNVVYDCGSIKGLSKYIVGKRKGQTVESEDELQLMQDLVTKYSSFENIDPPNSANSTADGLNIKSNEQVVILTGATGALGAHLLSLLRTNPTVTQIICLVRAASPATAHDRVNKSLLQREKPSLSYPSSPSSLSKILCLPTKLSDPRLGLSDEKYSDLATRTTMVIHAAWSVNFSTRLRSFIEDHIAGLHHLLAFALSSPRSKPPGFLFCSSTASVTSFPSNPIPEEISTSPTTASPLGYSRSKWVAEAICAHAYRDTRMRGRIAVLRIGQLCGDRESGVWNVTEAWPLMLSSVRVTACLPMLEGEKVAWLPVDVAAEGVLEVAGKYCADAEGRGADVVEMAKEVPVFHILNPDRTTGWSDLLAWMQTLSPCPFEVVSAREWVERLENLRGEEARHPSRRLLGLWKEAYCGEEGSGGGGKGEVVFEMEKTRREVRVMREVRPVGEEAFGRIWGWMWRSGLAGEGKEDGEVDGGGRKVGGE